MATSVTITIPLTITVSLGQPMVVDQTDPSKRTHLHVTAPLPVDEPPESDKPMSQPNANRRAMY